MENLLNIEGISKNYPTFSLKKVSFKVKPGQIMGFIGRNGAGKTTTLKSIMNIVHPDEGKIYLFDKDILTSELEAKQRIGFSLSEVNYYPNRSIKELKNVIKRFYKNFNEDKFDKLCTLFSLKQNQKIKELSSGMKVKYSLAIALSHEADLLILDEPTSGLDPVSRDEILDIFREIVKSKERGILFSTHITSDLDKCASNITYIHNGSILFSGSKNEFLETYLFVKGSSFDEALTNKFISYKKIDDSFEGLIFKEDKASFLDSKVLLREPTIEEIIIYLEREENNHESFTL